MPIQFDAGTGAYVDTRVARGFPMGGMGTGGFSFNTDGSFGEFRLNNNWMCPVREVRGSFHALYVRRGAVRRTVVLRRPPSFPEYEGAKHIRSTVFHGMLPHFTLTYDDDLPITVALHGFTPHIPHDVRNSTLPAAVFRFEVTNACDDPIDVALLFSFENILGRGGSGHLGPVLDPDGSLRAVRDRVVYDSIAGNLQEDVTVGGRRGLRCRTTQRYDPRAHRTGVTGEYLLLVDTEGDGPALTTSVCDDWNAAAARASVLDDFAASGSIRSRGAARPGEDGIHHPAGAVAAGCTLAPGARRDVVFALAWWTADHVTEPALAHHRGAGPHDGVRAGHVYETYFTGIDALAAHVLDERPRLDEASGELPRVLADSTLPVWLVRALANSIDSVLCNTVLPASGRCYTIEGVDWVWPMGGLTGTSDQRLAAHPYTATFFPGLDLTELDEFRRLADARGAIPHGIGNCDLGLGTTDVPYGWPLVIKGFLPAAEWTDLSVSFVLQVVRHWRVTGGRALLDRYWPALVAAMEYVHGLAPRAVPEGGTTYDVWDFPGAFVYSATLYGAALAAMVAAAEIVDPARASVYRARAAACAARLDADLWDARGFFKTTDTRDTIFTAALAGDWAARWIGLDPVVAPGRAASHMRHQHRVLVTEAVRAVGGRYRALPRAEAGFDGAALPHPLAAGFRRDEEMTYVWQVLSFQAMEQIYLDQVAEGLETMRLIYDRIWHDGAAWSAGLRGNDESIYMTHPVIWAVCAALTGAALDAPSATLELSPRVGGEITRLRCPFFFPSLWAMLAYDPATGETTVEVLRTFGVPVTIDRVRHRAPSGATRIIPLGPLTLDRGRRFRVALDPVAATTG